MKKFIISAILISGLTSCSSILKRSPSSTDEEGGLIAGPQGAANSCAIAEIVEKQNDMIGDIEAGNLEIKKMRDEILRKEIAMMSLVGAQVLLDAARLAKLSGDDQVRAVVRATWEKTNTDFDVQMNCLQQRGLMTQKQASAIKEYFVLDSEFRKNYDQIYAHPDSVNEIKDQEIDSYKPNFPKTFADVIDAELSVNNDFKILVDGKELRDALVDTIRSATRYIHISFHHMEQNRTSEILQHELVAKKLGMASEMLTDLLKHKGWVLGKNDSDLQRWYLLKNAPDKDVLKFTEMPPNLIQENFSKFSKSFEIRVLADLGISGLSVSSNAGDSGLDKIFPILRRYDVDIVFVPSFLWAFFNYHTKFVVTDNQAIISGGNMLDKVMGWEDPLIWHDMALKVNGGLVNKVNQFFVEQFNLWRKKSALAEKMNIIKKFNKTYSPQLAEAINQDKRAEGNDWFYYPRANERYHGPSQGIVTVTNPINDVDLTVKSTTEKALTTGIASAKDLIILANPFFSDEVVARRLRTKAKLWRLAEVKEKNGESLEVSTCDPKVIKKRIRGAAGKGWDLGPGGRGIVVILPKNMDQIMVKIANDAMINSLIRDGIDVCKWRSELHNDDVADRDGRVYRPQTMFHHKVWAIDDKVAYIGSANLMARSNRTDSELGIVFFDRSSIEELYKRLLFLDLKHSEPTRKRVVNDIVRPFTQTINWFGNLLKLW